MITQQYSILRYIIYGTIFSFHIGILWFIYNYSTKSTREQITLETLGKPKNEEAIVTLFEDQQPNENAPLSFPNHYVNSLPPFYMPDLFIPKPRKSNESASTESSKRVPAEEITQKHLDVPNELSTKASLEKPIIADPIKTTNIPQQTSSTNTTTPYHHSSQQTDSALSENDTKLNIPPTAFFQAFKNSYFQEQISAESAPSQTHKNSLDDGSKKLIAQRLGELKIADYIQQIKKAFYEAARRTPGMYLTSGKELKKDLEVKLEIQKEGSIKILRFQSSGIKDIDTYIKKFLHDIRVNPIPKSYKVHALPFSTKILINVNKDTRFYTICCFF